MNVNVELKPDGSKCDVCNDCVFLHCMAFMRWGRNQIIPIVGLN